MRIRKLINRLLKYGDASEKVYVNIPETLDGPLSPGQYAIKGFERVVDVPHPVASEEQYAVIIELKTQ